jgi:hypothetical protein
MTFAGEIVNEIKKAKRLPDYYNFLERKFGPLPDRARLHDEFHIALVQLGFCGLVTTNYEDVIESAVAEAFMSDLGPFRCTSIDLCQKRVYKVFDFFRSLSLGEKPRSVLHLHGYYTNPEGIILTEEDYKKKYGEQPNYDADGNAQNIVLDSLHRKVLWALFAAHPPVFVGFSLHDDFFMHMLRVVQGDFELGSDLTHFALMPFTTEADKQRTWEHLRQLNTMPVFYHVPEIKSAGEEHDHSDVKRLVYDLAEKVGVSFISSGITSINQRMLEL